MLNSGILFDLPYQLYTRLISGTSTSRFEPYSSNLIPCMNTAEATSPFVHQPQGTSYRTYKRSWGVARIYSSSMEKKKKHQQPGLPFSCTECGWRTNAPSPQEGGDFLDFFLFLDGWGYQLSTHTRCHESESIRQSLLNFGYFSVFENSQIQPPPRKGCDFWIFFYLQVGGGTN